MNRILSATLALALSATAALAAPAMTAESSAGPILTDANGMSLYTFTKDTEGVSNCMDDCVANWPILAAAEGDVAEGDWTIITRSDGLMQWAYKGMPLYLFVQDAAPGDITGEGKGEVWYLARP
ncbi:MAG: COG4315 family predicted lipoprotein [Paracoccaceae bacterium]